MKKFIYGSVFTVLYIMIGGMEVFAGKQLMRFPDIYKNQIVFVSGEDIWTVLAEGGIANRLTLDDGQERYPRFSLDGSMIAFTGEYDGNSDVYVMSSKGGDISRVTFHPGADEVIGWHPLKNKIIFSSGRQSTSRYTKLFLISPDGTGLEELIMYDAARGSFSPDGNQIAYNKTSREDRTWKRYQGGRAQEIYIYDFKTDEEKNITNFTGTDRMPMWIGDKIYYTSDKDRYLNLYSFDTKTNKTEQLTFHNVFDARRPESDSEHIVYEQGGAIWKYNIAENKASEVKIDIYTDAPETRPYIENVSDMIQDFNISPTGKRALINARGEIFSVPKSEGAIVNISNNCGSRDKDPAWSPDGSRIAYISDKSGEYEIYIRDAEGKSDAIRLTSHKNGYRHTLRWSPDGTKIAFADQTLRCYYLDINTKKITEVAQAKYENVDISLNDKPINDFQWSPDSKYIAYSHMNESFVYQVYIYSLETKKIHLASNGLFNDFNPVFTKDGEYLLFISNRRFDPTYCDIEWEMVYKNIAGIYALNLKKDGKSILPYKNDMENITKENVSPGPFRIDFDGLAERIEALPLPNGNYRELAVNSGNLFYLNAESGDFNRMDYRALPPRTLYAYNFETEEPKVIIDGINDYKISSDGSSIIYNKRGNIGIVSSNATNSKGEDLNLAHMKMSIDPRTEWKAVFNEAWRMERDFYYEEGMHGIDWDAMREKYGKLVEYASCRQDLQYIIGELIGELNTSHTYVYGGPIRRQASRVNVGVLGVDWQINNGHFQFKRILREPDWSREIYPPLAKPGLNINDGDYLLAVNGVALSTDKNIYSYFVDLAGQQVELLINSVPEVKGARSVTVVPERSETGMRYMDWLEYNRKVVDKASGGKIGYLYFPDTYNGSAIDFPRYFYSQTKKEGLIIDGRFNGGGLDPEIFFQRLLKKPHGYWTRRYSADQQIPALAVTAHMACLTNRYAGSGGDELPYEFQFNKMGPVIGTRTWGGLVGVSMFLELLDGSGLTAPDYRIYNEQGDWVVENEGVTPDIILEQKSTDLAKGYDTQLMKAVEVLMKKIKEEPYVFPKHKPFKVDK